MAKQNKEKRRRTAVIIIAVCAAAMIAGAVCVILFMKNNVQDGADMTDQAAVLSVEYSESPDEYGISSGLTLKDGSLVYYYNGGTTGESRKRTGTTDNDFEDALENIIREYNVRSWTDLPTSDLEVLDGSVTSMRIEFADHTTVRLGSGYEMPDGAWKAVSEIYDLMESYLEDGQNGGTGTDGETLPAESLPDTAADDTFSMETATYDDILRRCTEILTTENTEDLQINDDEPFTALIEVRGGSTPEEALRNVGYAIRDLNGDGTEELIIGAVNDDEFPEGGANPIYDLFTMDGSSVRLLFQGWSRNRCYASADGGYLNEGSSGASYSMFGKFRLEGTPAETVWETFCFTEPDADGTIRVYSNTEGVWDRELSAEKTDMTAEDFQNTESLLESQLIHAELRSLEEYSMPVTVCRLEDYGKEANTCVWVTLDTSDYQSHLVLQAKENVTDIRIFQLSMKDVDADGNAFFDSELLYEQSELTPELPLGVDLTFAGDLSYFGIEYTDAGGVQRQYLLGESGKDGSVYLTAGAF